MPLGRLLDDGPYAGAGSSRAAMRPDGTAGARRAGGSESIMLESDMAPPLDDEEGDDSGDA